MGNSTPTNGLAGQAAGAVQGNSSFLSTAMKAAQDNPAILQMALGALQGAQQSNQLVPIGHGYMKRAGGDVSNMLAGAGQGAISGQLEGILAKRKEDALMRELAAKTAAEGGLRAADNVAAMSRQDASLAAGKKMQDNQFIYGKQMQGQGQMHELDLFGKKSELEKQLQRQRYYDAIGVGRDAMNNRIEEDFWTFEDRLALATAGQSMSEHSPSTAARIKNLDANTAYTNKQAELIGSKTHEITTPMTKEQYQTRVMVQNAVARLMADQVTGQPGKLQPYEIENIDALIKSGVPAEEIIKEYANKPKTAPMNSTFPFMEQFK